jgi:hypothetical protein
LGADRNDKPSGADPDVWRLQAKTHVGEILPDGMKTFP